MNFDKETLLLLLAVCICQTVTCVNCHLKSVKSVKHGNVKTFLFPASIQKLFFKSHFTDLRHDYEI